MAIDPDLRVLTKEIDRLLADRRPDRYTIKDTATDPDQDADRLEVEDGDETAWLDDIAEEVAYLVPAAEIRTLYARKIVGQREGSATSRANKLLRDIDRTGQLILGWWDIKDQPISVVTRIVEPGKRPRVREERVALRATTPDDLRKFAMVERKRAGDDHAARIAACNGADWTADQMDQAGAVRFLDWAEGEIPPDAAS